MQYDLEANFKSKEEDELVLYNKYRFSITAVIAGDELRNNRKNLFHQ